MIALYIGALLGPMGGALVATMLPELSASFGVSRDTAALAVTFYLVPFALLQLVSGTLGERWGRRRSVRLGYLVYVAASLACAVSPSIEVFLAARTVQGMANAFTSPLLVAGLAELAPPARLTRSIGVYGSLQAAGQSLAPLVGGLSTAVDWRLAFYVVALVALALTFFPPPGTPRSGVAAPPFRALLTGPMTLLCAASFASFAGGIGLPFLVALLARDLYGATESTSGFVLVGFGVAGLLLGAVWGAVCDRYGARHCGVVAALLLAVVIASLPHAGSLPGTAGVWLLAGAVSSMLTVCLQNLAVRQVPSNRGGAVSVVSAFRFGGGAVAPLLWLPLYRIDPSYAFLGAGCLALTAAGWLTIDGGGRRPQDGH